MIAGNKELASSTKASTPPPPLAVSQEAIRRNEYPASTTTACADTHGIQSVEPQRWSKHFDEWKGLWQQLPETITLIFKSVKMQQKNCRGRGDPPPASKENLLLHNFL